MLQVRKNHISLRKCSGGSAHFTLGGALVIRESARFDNNYYDSSGVIDGEARGRASPLTS